MVSDGPSRFSVEYLKRATSGSFIIAGSSAALGILLSVILARILGPDGLGLYAIGLSFVRLLSSLSLFGLAKIVVREVATGISRSNHSLVFGVYLFSCGFVLLSSIFLALGFTGLSSLVSLPSSAVMTFEQVLLLLFLFPLVSLSEVQAAALRGMNHVLYSQVATLIRPLILLVISLLIVAVFRVELTINHVYGIMVIAAVGSFFVMFGLCINGFRSFKRKLGFQLCTRRWIKESLPLFIINLITVLHKELPVLMLGYFGRVDGAGFFRISKRGEFLLSSGTTAIKKAFGPSIAVSAQNDFNSKDLSGKLVHYTKLNVLLVSVIALGFIVFGEQLILLLWGVEFIPAYEILVVLSVGKVAIEMLGIVELTLQMARLEQYVAKASLVALVGLGSALAISVDQYGAFGAAVSFVLSTFLYRLILCFALYRKTGIRVDVFA
jgi:O-antigen/teichoic acid export membrane protein